jgi:hypothetical protein
LQFNHFKIYYVEVFPLHKVAQLAAQIKLQVEPQPVEHAPAQLPLQPPLQVELHPEHPPPELPVLLPEQDPEQLPEQSLQPDDVLDPEQSFAHPSQPALSMGSQPDKPYPMPSTAINGRVSFVADLKKSRRLVDSGSFLSFI